MCVYIYAYIHTYHTVPFSGEVIIQNKYLLKRVAMLFCYLESSHNAHAILMYVNIFIC